MKRITKKAAYILFALFLILPSLTFHGNPASASTTKELTFGGKVTDSITDTDSEQIYKITLINAGRITVNMDSYIYETYLDLTDQKGDYIWKNSDIYYGDSSNPKKWSNWVDLEPGTYYIKVHKYNKNTGNFDLSVNFTPANNTDIEPNNGTLQAQGLTVNSQKVTGFISSNDSTDYYKITLNKAGRVSVNLDSYIYETYLDLIDQDGNYIWKNSDIYYGDSDNPKKWTNWVDLEPGVYYINIHRYNNFTGKYDLLLNYQEANNIDIEPNNGTLQAQELTLNTQKVTGFISWNDDVDYYKIELKKAGRVSVNMDSYIYETYLNLIDQDGNNIWNNSDIYYGDSNTPKKWSDWEDLEPGTYYLKVHRYNNYTGKYILSVNYEEANNTDIEPNNGTLQAQGLTLNTQKITGYISWNDNDDYYKFTLPKAGTITVLVDSYINETYLDLIDINGNTLWRNEDIYYGKSNSPKKWAGSIALSPGTYYVRVHKYNNFTGKYTLSVSAPFLLPVISVDTVSNKSTTVSGKVTIGSTLNVKVGSKTYKAPVNSKGEYKLTIPVQNAGTKIEVTATNGYGSKKMIVTVIDRIAPKAPTVSVINSKSTYMIGKAEAYSTVVATMGNRKIGSIKTDKYGNYKMKIAPMKKGTVIKVAAIDSAGNKSTYTTVTVK